EARREGDWQNGFLRQMTGRYAAMTEDEEIAAFRQLPSHAQKRVRIVTARGTKGEYVLTDEDLDLVAEAVAIDGRFSRYRLSAADVDTALSWGPGLRWGIMGNMMLNHLGGGPGGIEHFFQQFAGPMATSWKALGSPVLTPEVQKKLIDSVH